MKVYARTSMSEIRLWELQELFEKVVYDPWNKAGERFHEREILEALKTVQPDISIIELDRITEAVVSSRKGLRVIDDCRANSASIDIGAYSAHGVPVLCTPARSTTIVTEVLVGILIAYMRKLFPATTQVRDGQWIEGTTPCYTWMGNRLYGKHVSFVGSGVVGKAVAHLLDVLGYNISYYDPYVNDTPYTRYELQGLPTAYDIIPIHLPVLPATEKLISRDLLYTMKLDAVFANTARSAVVGMGALQDMTREKRIKGILLDVLNSGPPLPDGLRIIGNNNAFLIPNICGATYGVTNHQPDTIIERLKVWKKQEQLKRTVYDYHLLGMPL